MSRCFSEPGSAGLLRLRGRHVVFRVFCHLSNQKSQVTEEYDYLLRSISEIIISQAICSPPHEVPGVGKCGVTWCEIHTLDYVEVNLLFCGELVPDSCSGRTEFPLLETPGRIGLLCGALVVASCHCSCSVGHSGVHPLACSLSAESSPRARERHLLSARAWPLGRGALQGSGRAGWAACVDTLEQRHAVSVLNRPSGAGSGEGSVLLFLVGQGPCCPEALRLLVSFETWAFPHVSLISATLRSPSPRP